MKTTVTVRLPYTFYDDHAGRELPSGKLLRTAGNQVVVELDRESFADLYSDAEFYGTQGQYIDEGLQHIVRSARRTLAALEKVEEFRELGWLPLR